MFGLLFALMHQCIWRKGGRYK